MISELAARTFAARDIAHREHWATKNYAAHVALGSFYDEVITAVDAIIEAYQGQYGAIDYFEVKTSRESNMAKFLTEECDWIEENRSEIANGSACIENLIDALTQVYCRTIFLLGLK